MLAAFVGVPCSSKTSTAARLFADLKERELSAEFLGEYARIYIAQKRRLEADAFVGLDNLDQAAILQEQAKLEEVLSADHRCVVIADSSAINSLLYMSDDFIRLSERYIMPYGQKNIIELARECAARYDLVFRCTPVRPGVMYDPNRIHSYEQSLELDKRLPAIFDLVGLDKRKVVQLYGDVPYRVGEASAAVMRKVVDLLKEQT
jgi:nicotinamide riboside kinase